MHLLGEIFEKIGIIIFLQKYKSYRIIHWFISLFRIHDIDGLIDLDVPWWSYSSIEEVKKFIYTKDIIRAFEYGSGASSFWLAKRESNL